MASAKLKIVSSTKKAKVKDYANALAQGLKSECYDVPPAFPCDKERVVFIGMTIKDAPDDKLRLFCRELNKQRAFNVALFIDGPKVEDNKGAQTVIELLKEAGTNVLEDDIYYVNGGSFFNRKVSLEERTEIVRWGEAVITKISEQ